MKFLLLCFFALLFLANLKATPQNHYDSALRAKLCREAHQVSGASWANGCNSL